MNSSDLAYSAGVAPTIAAAYGPAQTASLKRGGMSAHSRIRPSRYWLASLLFVSALAVAAPFAYIGSEGDVSVIDTASNKIVATVPQSGGGYGRVAANAAGTRIYATNWNSLLTIDTATNTVVGKVSIPNSPYLIAVDPGGARAYVAYWNWDGGPEGTSVIDLTTNTVVATVPSAPWGFAVNPEGTRLYVTDGYGISVLDAVTYAELARIANPCCANLAVTSVAGTRLYVTGGGVSIIDTKTNAVVATADIDFHPTAIAVDHAGARVYIATNHSPYPNSLVVLDATTLDIVATVPVGANPIGIAVDPTDTRIYVTNFDSNDVSVVDTTTNAVVATIPVSMPGGVVIPASPSEFDLNRRGLTGSWYQPATSGQGVELEVYEDLVAPGTGYLQGAWFTYDYKAAGGAASQRWYTFSGSVPTGQSSATLTLYQNVGGNFNALPVTSAVPVGSVVLTAPDCDHITMAYAFTDGSARLGTIAMRRLPPATCASSSTSATNADSGYSGNWFDAATSGQGVVLDFTFDDWGDPSIFFAWYTYAPNGQARSESGQRWYTGWASYYESPLRAIDTLTIDLYETTGGLFDKAAPAPSTVWVGRSTLNFTSCSDATLSYAFSGGSSAGASGTINLSRVGPAPAGCGP